MYSCFNCGTEVELSGKAGRRDICPNCNADIHVCLNCAFYDESHYNQCRESQAERVLEKDKSNFCDYFHFIEREDIIKKNDKKQSPRQAFDDLFK